MYTYSNAINNSTNCNYRHGKLVNIVGLNVIKNNLSASEIFIRWSSQKFM